MKKSVLLIAAFVMGIAATGFGQSITLNDTSYVYLDDHITGLTDATENMTMEAWVKPDSTGGWNDWCAAVYLRNDEGASLGMNLTNYRKDTVEMIPLWQDIYWIAPEIYLSIGTWQHIAMTVDVAANSMKGYLNGQLVYTYVADGGDNPDLVAQNCTGTTTNTISGNAVNAPFTIGKDRYHESWTGRTYKGGIDEVRIWNTTLTDAEIAANWNTKLNGDETGLVAYYDFTTILGSVVTNGGVGPTATIWGEDSETGEEGAPASNGIDSRRVEQLDNVRVYAHQNTVVVENGNGSANIEIMNVVGQVVLQEQIEGDARFDIEQGNVYIVKVSRGDRTYATKVLVR
ncbi:MAG: LamG-like jellyroll fold domain-containing protein [Bacteroidota bacterium]